MKCTELISRDHAVLRRGLDILDGMVKRLEDLERIEIADVAAILKFLRLFGDEYHQTMEEKVLFPALMGAEPHAEFLHHLLVEHGEERAVVAEIEAALNPKKGIAFVSSSRRLTLLLRQHLDKEDTVLREIAERSLSNEKDEMVAVELRTRDRPVARSGFAHNLKFTEPASTGSS
jgi:hemerythrin-like domain-containing protein